jgi:hypothetical protein
MGIINVPRTSIVVEIIKKNTRSCPPSSFMNIFAINGMTNAN